MISILVKAKVIGISTGYGYELFIDKVWDIQDEDTVGYPYLLARDCIIGEGYGINEVPILKEELERLKEKWIDKFDDDDKYVLNKMLESVNRAVKFNVDMRWT